MQISLFEKVTGQESRVVDLEALFTAYLNCRKNKRYTNNALQFELDYEQNLVCLKQEMESGLYTPNRSIAFVVNKPVKREIFASDFKDRVVHHWLIDKLNPLFETIFIEDSYACRTGKGTHFGVERINQYIRACSKEYTQDCYILKLDIQGFFMHISRPILFNMLTQFIDTYYHESDKSLVLEISQKIIFNNPTQHCIIKGNKKTGRACPQTKVCFTAPKTVGYLLAI